MDFKYILNLTIWTNILPEINRIHVEIRSMAQKQGLIAILQEIREQPI